MTVREDGSLDVDALETLVDENTRLIACGLASNGTGTIHDCHRIATLKKNALTFFDGVHYAPHNLMNVQALDADFLVVSPYKFFGPHCGALYGRRDLLASLSPDKLRVSDDGLPRDESCYLSRWELGTPSFEALSGATAAVDYLAALGDRFGGITDGGSLTRRDRLRAGFAAIGAHEHLLKRQFLDGVEAVPGLVDLRRDRRARRARARPSPWPKTASRPRRGSNLRSPRATHARFCARKDGRGSRRTAGTSSGPAVALARPSVLAGVDGRVHRQSGQSRLESPTRTTNSGNATPGLAQHKRSLLLKEAPGAGGGRGPEDSRYHNRRKDDLRRANGETSFATETQHALGRRRRRTCQWDDGDPT